MKITNKNKSDNKTKHKCDFCGKDPEELWMATYIDGQYCFEHYREAHEDLDAFDQWYKDYKNGKTNENV